MLLKVRVCELLDVLARNPKRCGELGLMYR